MLNQLECRWCILSALLILPESASLKGKNEVHIRFIAGDQSLNRNDEYLYTLLVPDRARTVFPCFEQPNLKAEFTLCLEVPKEWEAVSLIHSPSIVSSSFQGSNMEVWNTLEPLCIMIRECS